MAERSKPSAAGRRKINPPGEPMRSKASEELHEKRAPADDKSVAARVLGEGARKKKPTPKKK
jgi:hypothetical protein